MPPPSSGAIAIGQILGILNNTPAATLGLVTGMGGVPGTTGPTPSADWLHLYTEASRLAFADRGAVPGRPGLRAAARRQLDEPAGARAT